MKRYLVLMLFAGIALGGVGVIMAERHYPQPVSAVGFTLNGAPYGVVVTTSDGDTNFYEPSDQKLAAIIAKLPPASRGVLKVTSAACTRPQVY